MPIGPNTRYNSNTFGLEPHSKQYTIVDDPGTIPESHKNYLIHNIGRTVVTAKIKYGTKFSWIGVLDEATVQPGEFKTLDNGGKPYYVTGLKVYNNSDERAVVHCATDDDMYFLYAAKEPGTFDEIRNKLVKSACGLGVKYVPYVRSSLSGLVSAFWPRDKPSAWEEVQEKIKPLVDQKILDAISDILSGDLKQYQERITLLSQEIDNGRSPEDLKVNYMSIAQDLIGLERKFTCRSDTPEHQNINQYVLPHYSTTVLLTISFYVIGIKQADKIGLNEENIDSIKSYANRTIYDNSGANRYIEDLYKSRVDNAYKEIFAEDLYDNMMNVRSFIGTQGLEYIRIWNYLLEHLSDEGLYNDVITYSTLYGRQTANTIKEAITEELIEPLTPGLVDDRRNRMSSIDVYIWRINNGGGPARIGGLKLVFENGHSYPLGTVGDEVKVVEFNTALLVKLEAFGDGAIDALVFHFSDGRVEVVGETGSLENTVFELKDHHIVSMFLSSDNYILGGQAANISVAYKLTEKSKERDL